jgi:hypothetical protein
MALIVGGLFAGACATVAGLDNEYAMETAPGGGGEGGHGGGGAGAGGMMDAGTDADTPSSCTGGGVDCVDAVPPGWTRVGYAPSRETPCPSGFTQTDVQADPLMGAETCVCGGCQITDQPSCAAGNVQTFIDLGSGQCGVNGINLANSPAGACNKFSQNGEGVTVSDHVKGLPPPPSGGACSLKAAPDSSKVVWTEGRVCIPESEPCELDLCAGQGGFTECILAEGDSECPLPFTEKHFIGDASNLVCGACACTVEGSCTGTIELYTDINCTAGKLSLPVDGTCVVAGSNETYYRYKYIGQIKAITCSDEPPTSAGLTPSNTLCCK